MLLREVRQAAKHIIQIAARRRTGSWPLVCSILLLVVASLIKAGIGWQVREHVVFLLGWGWVYRSAIFVEAA